MRAAASIAALAAWLALAPAPAPAAVTVVDDSGQAVTLAAPARRIISLAPHVTELLFAAGGGERIVGVMNFSDYPEAAKAIPLVGSSSQIDMEKVLSLKPDLIMVWQSGNTSRQLEQLRRLGIPLFHSEPVKLDQVADSLVRFGTLLGTAPVAQAAAARFRSRIGALAARHAARPPVRVFYQVWDKPLYTLGAGQIVGDALRICGGVNIFGTMAVKAPAVSVEAVLQENPEAIFAGGQYEEGDGPMSAWRQYKGLLAVQRGNLFPAGGDVLTRAGPRMAEGVAVLCEKLELTRQRRK